MESGPELDPDPHPDPLVRGLDPWIRIRTKMSWIPNTCRYPTHLHAGTRTSQTKYVFISFFTKGFDLSADNIGWKNIFDHSTAAASMEIFPPTGLFRTFLLSGEKV
jgi:hypothetical protein